MDEDVVNVSSTKHHEILVSSLWKFCKSQIGVDFDFRLGGGGPSKTAHRIVVESFMLPVTLGLVSHADNEQADCHLDALLEFLYLGAVAVPKSQLPGLLDMAKELEFEVLVEAVQVASNARPMRTRSAAAAGQRRKIYPVKSEALATNSAEVVAIKEEKLKESVKKKPRLVRSFAKKPLAAGRKVSAAAASKKHPRTARSKAVSSASSTDDEMDEDDDDDDDIDNDDEDPIFRNIEDDEASIDLKPLTTWRTVKAPDEDDDDASGGVAPRKRKKGTVVGTNGRVTFRCEHCPFRAVRKTAYELHRATHDPSVQIFPCSQCKRKFTSQVSLQSHESWHAGTSFKFSCPQCPSTFSRKSQYDLHQAKHDPTIQIFRCNLCGRKFLYEANLERHRQSHKDFQCPHCYFVTAKRWNYLNHLFAAHKVNAKNEPRVSCPHCPYTCKLESQLQTHVQDRHSGVEPFRCDQCDYWHPRRGELNKHIRIVHLDIKKHLCDTCGYRTVSRSKLLQHNLVHTGEKPFKCETCGKAYSDGTTLKRHNQEQHLGGSKEKRFCCHICGHGCNRRFNLKVHLRNVHKMQVAPESATMRPTARKPRADEAVAVLACHEYQVS